MKNKLDIVKNLLSSGELVIFPTETVFGLGADATNDEVIKSIFKVKKDHEVIQLSVTLKVLNK